MKPTTINKLALGLIGLTTVASLVIDTYILVNL